MEQVRKEILKPGTMLQNRYRLERDQGQGAADILYEGWDLLFSRRVLVQELYPAASAIRMSDGTVLVASDWESTFESARKQFRKDGEHLIGLDGTPGLLNVFSVFEEHGTVYIIIEYPGKLTLSEVLREQGGCSLEEVNWLVQELAEILSYAHSQGLYHGQISPECCFFNDSGDCRLGRFNQMAVAYGANEVERPQTILEADIRQLAEMTACILSGIQAWEADFTGKHLRELKKSIPDYAADALEQVLNVQEQRMPQSIRRFADLFMGEATIELRGGSYCES